MNISILFTDEFMEAVKNDTDYTLRYHVESTGENIERVIRARDFFMEFCETQWDWGDPGALFSDRLNDYHLLAGYPEYKIENHQPMRRIRRQCLQRMQPGKHQSLQHDR